MPPPTPDPSATPMMQQYLEAKAACPDALVMMRMGDFYELFLDDAVQAAELLELTLTSRNKKDDNPIPMAGVPHHALDAYIPRLLAAGRKVAIVEQVEDPRLAKGLVRREIARVISPGVVLDEAALDTREPNWLAALVPPLPPDTTWGLAWLDVSTGRRQALTCPSRDHALAELARLDPRELLLPTEYTDITQELHIRLARLTLTTLPPPPPDAPRDPAERAALATLTYARSLQRSGDLPLRPLVLLGPRERMALPATTLRNLELLRSLRDGTRKGSLLHLIDQTRTAIGGRLLRDWLLAPLLDLPTLTARHDLVQAALEAPLLRDELRHTLRTIADLERLTGRLTARVASPRDLAALATSLATLPELTARLAASEHPALAALGPALDLIPELAAELHRVLVDAPPPTLKDGGVIRPTADPDLAELVAIADDGKGWFDAYEAQLREESGISSLKIRFNSVFGYMIEVTRANLHHVPDTWLRKQTLANAERYFTVALKEREERVLGAHDARIALEERLFVALRDTAATFAPRLLDLAERIATLDIVLAFADLAATRAWVRPRFTADAGLHLTAARHPIVEASLPAGSFVPNDLTITPNERLIILTGPNMAGKSTVMRQAALIAILAQIGSFVPADAATLGLIDQVFTRVGASDDLARGQSTFMVEMTETAEILAQATDRSLVILDEIGRGTSTWDGLSIAWAVAEHLHDETRCLTLFATHYHELTELALTRDAVRNLSMAIREHGGDIVFLRRLIQGGANKSYGVEVARLAGLPTPLLDRARTILANLEASALDPDSRPRLARGGASPKTWQLSLFSPATPAPPAPELAAVRRLLSVDPDSLTPRAALDLVYQLRRALEFTKST